MKLTRQQFLKALPASALLLAGCAAKQTAPANTETLVFDHAYPLDYRPAVHRRLLRGGSTLLTLTGSGEQFLVLPEDAAEVDGLPAGVTALRQPVQNIYLVSTSVMDLFLHLDALDCITLSGTQAAGWHLDEARAAMEAGRIAYAGKYSAPDYEQILASNCGLAIENTMILHTPEVKEQLERFGIPVVVERSSYESSPLARMEWIKFWGILLGRETLAEQVFQKQGGAHPAASGTGPPPARPVRSSPSRPTTSPTSARAAITWPDDRDGRGRLCVLRPDRQRQ